MLTDFESLPRFNRMYASAEARKIVKQPVPNDTANKTFSGKVSGLSVEIIIVSSRPGNGDVC